MDSIRTGRKRDILKSLVVRRKNRRDDIAVSSLDDALTGGSIAADQPCQQSQDRSHPLWAAAIERLDSEDQKLCNEVGDTVSKADVLRSLLEVAKAKQVECNAQKWECSLFGRELVPRDIVAKIVKYIEKFQAVGDTVASFDPAHAALPWAAIKVLLQFITSGDEQNALLLIGLERTSQISNIIQANENLETSLLKLYVELLKFLTRSLRAYRKHRANRYLASLFTIEDFKEQLRRLSYLESSVAFEAANSSSVLLKDGQDKLQHALDDLGEPVSRIDSSISDLHEAENRRQRAEILRWISDLPYEDIHKALRKGGTEGTGQWLFQEEECLRWQNSKSSSVLWLFGSPGTGKTKLMTKAVDKLLDCSISSTAPCVYFYCDRNQAKRRDPVQLMASFVRQLASFNPNQPLLSSISKLYRQREEKGFASESLNLEESIDLLVELVNLHSEVFVIIDGLDECERESRIKLVDILASRLTQGSTASSIKLLISSRPDRDIKYRLESGPSLEIDVSRNFEDIKKYVDDQLGSPPSWWRGQVDDSLRQQIYETLTNQCQGMFQWAVLQVKQLFRLSLRRDILDRLGKLPKDLDSAYDQILKAITDSEGSAPKVAKRAFEWLMCRQEPVTDDLLTAAVCQDHDSHTTDSIDVDVDYILDACQNLLIFDKYFSEFRFAHLSVREYFELDSNRNERNHAVVGKTCLKLLMNPMYYQKSYYDPYGEIKYLTASRDSTSLDRVVSLVDYARQHWALHVRKARCSTFTKSLKIHEALQNFLGSFEATNESFEYYLRWLAGNIVRDYHGTLSKKVFGDYYRSVPEYWGELFNSYSGKILFGICWFGLDEITGEQWSQWQLDFSWKDTQGHNLFLTAAATGSLCMAQHLWKNTIQELAAPAREENLNQALDAACEHGKSEMVKFLLSCGASVESSCRLIRYAIEDFPQSDLLEILLRHGANPNIIEDRYGGFEFPLETAVVRADLRSVQLLLAYGAKADAPFKYGNVLYYASGIEIMKGLLEHGADVNANGGSYGYPLREAVKLLLDHGADIDAQDPWDKITALLCAVLAHRVDVVKTLLDRGAEVNTMSAKYGTCLHELKRASAMPYLSDEEKKAIPSLVDLLIQHGAIDKPPLSGSIDQSSEDQFSEEPSSEEDRPTELVALCKDLAAQYKDDIDEKS